MLQMISDWTKRFTQRVEIVTINQIPFEMTNLGNTRVMCVHGAAGNFS